MQLVEIELDPGERARAEAGAMMYMGPGIEMQTSTGGGMFKGFKRMITGESFFITTFLHNGAGKGHVAFAAPLSRQNHSSGPGKSRRHFSLPKGRLPVRRPGN